MYHLNETGTAAIVLPHGVLFRGSSEYTIRKKLIDDNHVHAVIGLPANVFFGTSIPTCILVLKQKRTTKDILFIDASNEFVKDKNKNYLTEENIVKIIETYSSRKSIDKFSYLADSEEIVANDYNLNISRYVDMFVECEDIDCNELLQQIQIIKQEYLSLKNEFNEQNKYISHSYSLDNSNAINKLLPKIRYRDFNDPWKRTTIDKLFKITRGKVLSSRKISDYKTDEMVYPVYSSQTLNNGLLGYYKDYLFEDAITWTTDGAYAGTVKFREGKFFSTNVNGVLLSDQGFANKAIAEILNLVAWKHVNRNNNPKLMNNVMAEIEINIPTLVEQSKLSNFFNIVDNLISKQENIISHYKILKQSLLQKMFPKHGTFIPTVRYEEFKEPWKLRKFGDLGNVTMNRRIFKDQTSTTGEIPFFKIGTFGGIPDAYISRELFELYKSKYPYPEKGDILISAAGSIGRTVVYQGKDEYFQDSNIVWLKHNGKLDNQFLKQVYDFIKWKNLEGTTIRRLYNKNILETELYVPSLEEQGKIGLFFNNLDQLIMKQQEKLETLKTVKKAYLQKMFV